MRIGQSFQNFYLSLCKTRNSLAVVIIVILLTHRHLIDLEVYTKLRSSEPRVNAFVLGSGSSGVRFSGEKVRSFNPKDTIIFIPKESSNEDKILLFPSPADSKDVDNGFANGTICQQWAVVTTIHNPDASILGVADLKNWCLVIVGDIITPDIAYVDLAMKDNVFYLSASYQKEFLMNSRNPFIEMMPFKSFARKNIGYLFAINYGARVIFDFDDDNILLPLDDGTTIPPPFHFDNNFGFDRTVLFKFIQSEATVVNNTKTHSRLAFNPYSFMGASHDHSWPRGFPIDQLKENFLQSPLETTEFGDLKLSSIGVIQSLCNGDPDNDAIFRMTRPDSTSFTFQRSPTSMSLLIPSYAYSPYNAQATTHLYNAFWGLYLPITVPGRVTDIWRSYITQRIMKDIGLHVLYTPPIVVHERSAHDYLSDFIAEMDLSDKTTKMLEFIDGWSSDSSTLPARIFELWVGLYEHDYLELQDVKAVGEWLKTLIAIGYDFPIIDNPPVSMALPQIQPTVDDQPYRSFPSFNVDKYGNTLSESLKHGNAGSQEERPASAVVKLIMMTMDEWPLIKSWVLYHGHLLGFDNLYIVDSSTDDRVVSFLRYSRDILGVNVLFSDTYLNELTNLMSKIANNISGSSDFIIKMDTDEFLAIYDNRTETMTTSISEYLSGFSKNDEHPLRIAQATGHSAVGYVQGSIPMREVCDKDIHSAPENFPLNPVNRAGLFKAVFSSRQPNIIINLGGHVMGSPSGGWTSFGVLHYHSRCVEIEVENCKRVLERHHYIEPMDSNEEAKLKLANKFKCDPQDICNTCSFDNSFNSVHKAVYYAKWLDCEERMKEEYYPLPGEMKFNSAVIDVLRKSNARYEE